MHHASVSAMSWHCSSERISWSGTQRTWRRWEIESLLVRDYGLNNVDNLYSHLRRIQRDFDWCYWWFNKTFPYRKAKNYQFLIWDNIWTFHWSKEYCKLHSLVVYYLPPNSSLQHGSLCFSSDDKNHYASFLCQVQTMHVYYLNPNHPHIIKKLINFSESCGGQYKNSKNFIEERFCDGRGHEIFSEKITGPWNI